MYWYLIHYCDMSVTFGNRLFATLANNEFEANDKLYKYLGSSEGLFIADISPVSRKDLAELGCSQGVQTDVENIPSFIKDEYFAPAELCL